MTQKRNYIIPEVAVLNCCTRECLMWAIISNASNPAPKRQDKPF